MYSYNPLKLEKIKRKIIKIKSKSYLRKEERFNKYIYKKIAKFYKLSKPPKWILTIGPNNIIYKSINLRKCNFKICKRFILRVPTNNNDMFIKFVSLLNDKADIQMLMREMEMTRVYNRDTFKNKYIYIMFVPSAQL